MHPLVRGALDLIYPPRCEACGLLRREPLCEECSRGIEYLSPPICEVCGEPFDPGAKGAPRCADCRGRRRAFSRARSAAYYDGPLVEAIRRFKYDCQAVLWRRLGEIMVNALATGAADLDINSVEVLCPVPLHETRLRERGFNQSELLAEAVAASIDRPVRSLLQRIRPTLPQVELPAQSRAANVHDAFAPDLHEVISGRCVLLVDDLYTTGATMAECSRALKRAGAAEIRIFTLARPLPRWRMARMQEE
jgi:ComF family protein